MPANEFELQMFWRKIMRESKKKRVTHIVWIAACIVISFVFLIPLYYTIVNSLRSLYSNPVLFFPKDPAWGNYKYAVTLIPFLRYLGNSLLIVSITVFFGITIDFFYGYAFARLKAKGRGILFMVLLAQMMIPGFALQIPQYIAFSNFGIKDTYWIWIFTGLSGSPFIVFLYKQYVESIPKEIEEAAFMDGCGVFRIIVQVYMPMCKSILAVGLFRVFIAEWGNYMTPYMFLSEKKYPLSIALFNSSYMLPGDPAANMDPVKSAAALLFAVPAVIVFFLCQKKLVSGLTAGSVKG